MGLISRVSSRTYRFSRKTKPTFCQKKTKMSGINVRTRKYMTNRLLNRKQMVVDVNHSELATPAKKTISDSLAKMYKAASDCIVVYGLHTAYGGGKTTGFANIYDSLDYMKKHEKRSNLVRLGQAEKIDKKARQQRKQLKNRKKKVRGTKKDKIGAAKK